jgi:Asp/Glu/hydantoin racemase
MDLQFSYFQFLNDVNVVQSILKATKEGYHGVAAGCVCDSGVHLARGVTDIPIGGLAESGMLAACLYGRTFCILTYAREEGAKRIEDLIRLYRKSKGSTKT